MLSASCRYGQTLQVAASAVQAIATGASFAAHADNPVDIELESADGAVTRAALAPWGQKLELHVDADGPLIVDPLQSP